jgi:hypothetical protein
MRFEKTAFCLDVWPTSDRTTTTGCPIFATVLSSLIGVPGELARWGELRWVHFRGSENPETSHTYTNGSCSARWPTLGAIKPRRRWGTQIQMWATTVTGTSGSLQQSATVSLTVHLLKSIRPV